MLQFYLLFVCDDLFSICQLHRFVYQHFFSLTYLKIRKN